MAGNRALRVGAVLAGAAALAAAGWALREVPAELGARPRGARAARVRRSPQFKGSAFANSMPSVVATPADSRQLVRDMLMSGRRRKPAGPVPVLVPTAAAESDLDIVWYGHATTLVEIEGRRVLFDPVWSDRCSPTPLLGPKRLHPLPVPAEELPPLDAIVISHDHYDHLDMATVRTLTRTQVAPFLVPLGVGAHLDRWGVPSNRIVELDWNETFTIAGLRVTVTEARHFSGRGLSRNPTLWGSWVLAGERRKVFYTGDSGYFDGYAAIGAAYGPFDVTLMQIGAYSPSWPDIHMTPEEAVEAHVALGGELLVPVHWATFVLAFHSWAEPVDRLWREAKARDLRLAVPRPGERISADRPPAVDGWWQGVA
ncbi:MBL fold metallo-hydrolase [Microtetraspora sp. AC03309]|uniref:MBL fold metallo-hydrolase n=1 Tax=Microtetraspora sp. AC03309 TaxID=2779376 RepID=UPI001E440072|nr:MBL fold metallo-hydrolase [Microtetraspora sp. AC03309]MCC5582090.1 MBL fold metallo-hydrolase [Microtetraspora sp. AC03309]